MDMIDYICPIPRNECIGDGKAGTTMGRLQGRKEREPFVLEHASIATGDEKGTVQKDMSVLVSADGRIEQVCPTPLAYVPSGYHRINATGKFVAPGLINAHTHLFADGKPLSGGTDLSPRVVDAALKVVHSPAGRVLMDARIKGTVSTLLNSGVTTIRTLGDVGYEAVRLRDRIDADELTGPRMLAAGPLLAIPGGHGDPFIALSCSSPEEARRRTRENLDHGVNAIKVAATGGVTDATKLGEAGSPQMTEEEMAAVCDEAHEFGVLVAAHAQSPEGVKAALKAGVDTIEHGSVLDDEMIGLFLDNPRSLRGFSALDPTLSAGLPLVKISQQELGISDIVRGNSELVVDGMVKSAKQAHENGIAVGVGTDTGMTFVPQYGTWRELDYLVRYADFTPAQAFHAATQVNARNLGFDNVTGSVDTGKDADLIVLDEDPAKNVRTLADPKLVIVRGKPVWRPEVKHFEEIDRLLDSF